MPGTCPAPRLREDLKLPSSVQIVSKGRTRTDDGYSAVAGEVAGRGTLLEDLKTRGVDKVIVGGLATDYCVKHSVLDLLSQGYAVTVLTDAIRAVDVKPGDGQTGDRRNVARGGELLSSSRESPDQLPASNLQTPDSSVVRAKTEDRRLTTDSPNRGHFHPLISA